VCPGSPRCLFTDEETCVQLNKFIQCEDVRERQ